MAKYDDASWHYGGDYPTDLPPENGGIHIGIFLTWCIETNLLSEFQLEESKEDVNLVLNRKLTGTEFLMRNCDEKFTDEDLNDLGNSFAVDYYEDEGEFSKKGISYLSDYQYAVELLHREMGTEMKSFYHVEDSWDFYEGIKIILNQRFEQWKSFKGIS